jgi:thioredoxin-like negative regulator of GroEL
VEPKQPLRRRGARNAAIALASLALLGWLLWCQSGRTAAELAISRKQWDRAEPRLRHYLWLHPYDPQANYRLAEVLARSGRCEEAVERLARVPDDSALGPQSRLLAGETLLYCLHRGRDAEVALKRTLELDPNVEAAKKALVYLYFLESRQEDARPLVWELYQSSDPITRYRALANWFLIQFSELPTNEATAELNALIDGDPDDPDAGVALAGRWLRENQFDRAARKLESFVVPGEHVERLSLLVQCYLKMGMGSKAAALLERWPDEKRDIRFWRSMGIACQTFLNRPTDAVAYLLRVLEVQPDDWEVHHRLALSLRQLNRMQEAEVHEKESRRLQGVLDYEATASLIREHLTRPDEAATRFQTAQFYEQLGLKCEARAWFELTLDLDANHAESRAGLERLAASAADPSGA